MRLLRLDVGVHILVSDCNLCEILVIAYILLLAEVVNKIIIDLLLKAVDPPQEDNNLEVKALDLS